MEINELSDCTKLIAKEGIQLHPLTARTIIKDRRYLLEANHTILHKSGGMQINPQIFSQIKSQTC